MIFILVETIRAKNTGFEIKTLWDWMELLVIPAVLAVGAFYLNRSERAVERQIAEERAKLEREIATDRQQEASLQSYLDRMAELLLNEKLRTTQNDEVRDVARIRTLTVVRGLDGKRKGLVLKFLREAKLIEKEKPVIKLFSADFSGADLSRSNISGVDLMHVNLQYANLQRADLSSSTFFMANLQYSDMGDAYANDTIFYKSDLSYANLQFWDAKNIEMTDAQLEGAIMPDGTRHE